MRRNLNRIIKGLLVAVFAAVALFVMAGAVNNTSAAVWHQGTPKILRGKWRTKVARLSGISGRAHLHITKHALTNSPKFPPQDPNYSNKLHYRYLGKHVYSIVGREYNNAPAGGLKIHFLAKVYSHHKIYFKQYNGRSDGNGVFYKY